jgi:hypothetical protein
MRAVSLDNPAVANEFLGLLGREGKRWFWTGGRISGQSITWSNGNRQNAGELRNIFSHTGG